MRTFEIPRKKTRVAARAVYTAVAFVLAALNTAVAQDKVVTQETLLDRIQIEDFLTRYYFDLMAGSGRDLADYYTEDAVLDVNSTIATGHEEIEALYGSGGEDGEDGGGERMGRGHMLLTNPIIEIDGDTATAWVVWTGVMNDDIKEPPRLFEQGREYTELVKRDGRWLIQARYISADSGMPDRWDSTYEPRTHR